MRFSLLSRNLADLTGEDIAPLLIGALRHFDGDRYLLFDYVIMPDHVHCIVKPIVVQGQAPELFDVLYSVKKWTATRINRLLQRRGMLWQREHYDHIIRRREDFEEKARYVFNNPHAAGLVDDPAKWRWWGQGSGARGG